MNPIEQIERGLREGQFLVNRLETGGIMVKAPPWHPTVPVAWFMLWDNGGEVGVERINSGVVPAFFPIAYQDRKVGRLELLCRAVSLLEGETIQDYGQPVDWEGE